ncbi:uncharacterized protein F5891DRAFT_1201532 [Suillus fuscotomentosus]|uniref:Uncharacterized protein n=1 Tax=Suillus fuscotomentosus TaxID=1912939 RepID=A0AAD4HCA4_9AGAM|nr:uncharacterized protein F5891DRAFT_1201532 [Suillus fuscotomentosus]KAG1885866.1 hypothetical protein F5891DRAFT_1201532 [Suillus fuscotomentosus]
MAKASKNTPAKSTSEGKKNSKITETGSKRGLKGRENSAREEDGDAVSLEPPEIEWTKELTFQMLTEITEDEDIKQGLFPLVLRDKGTPKQKEAWHTKIKNRLKRMTVNTLKYIEVMGATGAGIKKRSDVDKSRQNQFVIKWMEIEGACPYFFEMCELIARLTGGYASEEWDIERQTPECGNDSAKNVALVPSEDGKHVDGVQKRWGTENEKAPRKKKQKKDEFAEIVQAEEVTWQKEMDVAKARAEKDIMRAKIKLAKIELEREKLCDQRERRRDRAARKHPPTIHGHYREASHHSATPSFDFAFHDDIEPSFMGPGPSSSRASSADPFSDPISRSDASFQVEYILPAVPQ